MSECSICSTPDADILESGEIGIIPVRFCGECLNGIVEMVMSRYDMITVEQAEEGGYIEP